MGDRKGLEITKCEGMEMYGVGDSYSFVSQNDTVLYHKVSWIQKLLVSCPYDSSMRFAKCSVQSQKTPIVLLPEKEK